MVILGIFFKIHIWGRFLMAIPQAPFNVQIIDVDAYVKQFNILPVTSFAIKEASESTYHPSGLFSEQIFGQIGTPQRLIRFGYIDLHSQIIQPIIFKNLVKLDALYDNVMAGRSFATFDESTGFLNAADITDEGADTGFQFFISILPKLKFRTTTSSLRNDRIEVIEKYRDLIICDKLLVMPAGLRDIRDEEGRISQEDINGLYRSVMSYASQIPSGTTSSIFDSFRYNLQHKVEEIYDYIKNLMDGKKAFLQGNYTRRKIAGGTRNVISAAQYAAKTPTDPQILHSDETQVGLFQALKANQPKCEYIIRTVYLNTIFSGDSNQVALTNPDTYELEYVEVPRKELKLFTDPDAIDKMINRFRNVEIRNDPISITLEDGSIRYLHMVYDTGTDVYYFRNLPEFRRAYKREIDMSYIRPMTWTEMFYVVAVFAYAGCHGFVTRYPVIEDGSCFPTKVKLATTIPSRVVAFRKNVDDMSPPVTLAAYPILGNPYQDTLVLHASRLKGLGADHDGDTCSFNVVASDDANQEIAEYLNSAKAVIDSQKQLVCGPNTDNVKWTFINMTLSRDELGIKAE